MFSEVHGMRVLYKQKPEVGNYYRQIAVVEKHQFEVRVYEGEVLLTDPEFSADNPDAEIYLHSTLDSATADMETEFKESVAAGWKPYSPIL
jgi:hypothetical protein